MDVSSNVKASFALAQRLRQPFEARWQRLCELAMPYRTQVYAKGSISGPPDPPAVYDETGLVSIEECAARMQDGIMPNGVHWARFRGGPGAPTELQQALAEWQEQLFDQLAQSNLFTEVADCFKDLAGPGNWCLRAMSHGWRRPLAFTSIAMPNVWVTPGAHGAWGDIHVRHPMPLYAVKAEWPGADLSSVNRPADEMVWVIDSWLRDMTAPVERWRWETHLDGHLLAHGEETGAGSNAYLFGRWGKGSGELYGTGQGLQALPAIEVVNEAIKLILWHGDLALSGMWQADDDGVLNPWTVKFVPGTVIARAPGSRGLEALQYPGTRLDIGQLVLNEQRFAIRKALFAETLGAREGTPPSATEVEVRMAELARQVGPSIMRVWGEFSVPLLERVRFLLDRRGMIQMPAIDGQKIRVAPVSALVRAAARMELNSVDRLAGGIRMHYGDQSLPTILPVERYARFAAERLDVPPSLLLSDAERRRMAAQAAQAAQEAGQAGPGGDAAPALAQLALVGGANRGG